MAAEETTTAPRQIDSFVRALGVRHRLWSLGLALAGHALVVAVALCLLDQLLPRYNLAGLLIGAGWLAGVTGWTWLRSGLPLAEADRQLGLGDRLLTWAGLGARRRSLGAMGRWLEQDLGGRLAALPVERTERVWRRPMGALRYLLPVLIVVLLLRLFAPLMPPLPLPVPSAVAEAGGARSPGESGEGPAQPGGPDKAPPAPVPEPGAEEPPPPEQAGEEPPRPLLDLPPQDEFVIPDFIGEGPERKQLARRALLEEREDRGAAASRRRAASGGRQPRPETTVQEFRRALERALRARHVPASERSFVKAYFQALVESAR